jgi:hypothetical protein
MLVCVYTLNTDGCTYILVYKFTWLLLLFFILVFFSGLLDISKQQKKMQTEDNALCVVCGKLFDEQQEFGKWNCKQHPYPIVTKKSGANVFACCELHTYSQTCVASFYKLHPSLGTGIGCVAADHRTHLPPFDDREGIGWIEIPRETCAYLGVPASHVTVVQGTIEPGSHVRVYRYNWKSDIYKEALTR